MAPNRQAMVLMLKECENFSEESNITFSSDPNPEKSKSRLIFKCRFFFFYADTLFYLSKVRRLNKESKVADALWPGALEKR